MSVLIFFIVLAVLVLVHELGHFLIAKKAGVRVDEFGLGFPPRIWGKKMGETVYSLNLIPFGGFVKIFGEDPNSESISGPDRSRSLISKNRGVQALVLSGGVLFNLIFAWLLVSLSFMSGLPASTSYMKEGVVKDPKLLITGVVPGSPAAEAGLLPGDEILYIGSSSGTSIQNASPEEMTAFIGKEADNKLTFLHKRGDESKSVEIVAKEGIVEGKKAVGVSMDEIGVLKLSPHLALYHGFLTTGKLIWLVTITIADMVRDALVGQADLSQITGPVGIVGLVGEARELGFIYLLSFTALISINLAVVNLIPFPALDGGRLLFVLIEAIKRSPISPRIANALNGVGFALLLLLMAIITYRDIIKLF